MKEKLEKAASPIVSILLSFLCGAVVILLIGENPFTAFAALGRGAFGSALNISNTIAKITTLSLCGLSYAFAYRCGLCNIGSEGQMYIGALVASVVVLYMPGSGVVVIITAICAGFLAAALFGVLIALLKIHFGANEVITTVMFNYVAQYLVQWAVSGPIQDPKSDAAQTVIFDKKYWIGNIPGTQIGIGFLIMLACLVFFGIFIWKTVAGFALQLVGRNRTAAAYAGISVNRNFCMSMFLAGGFGGLAGAVELLGVQHRLVKGMASNYGFDGIAVALLGENHPVGMLLSGSLLGAMKSGGNAMQMFTKVPSSVVDLIRAMVVVFVLVDVVRRGVRSIHAARRKQYA